MRRLPLTATALLCLTACGEPAVEDVGETERPPIRALAGIPVPVSARALSTSGTGNSVEITLIEEASPDSLADYYRLQFLRDGWDIQADARLPDGTINLHAVLGDRPVWVLIEPRAPSGSRFRVVAGVRDATDSTP